MPRHRHAQTPFGPGSRTCDNAGMNDSETHPYTLEIISPKEAGGVYQWAIRKNGKMAERSDRDHRTEARAREHGMAQIEKLLSGRGAR